MHTRSVSISVEEWCELAKSGDVMPIRIQLNGKSMEPLIRFNRDYVTVVPLRREPVKGDIIIFPDSRNRYCAHRVRRISADSVQTIGDNTLGYDPWIKKSDIAGILITLERDGKKYDLQSRKLLFYGRVRMFLFPLRKAKRKIIGALWETYLKVFRRSKGGKSDA